MKIDGNIITPSENKWLSNGFTASKKVILAVNDSSENWSEITEEEADAILNPEIEEELDDSEALDIILGGAE